MYEFSVLGVLRFFGGGGGASGSLGYGIFCRHFCQGAFELQGGFRVRVIL